METDLGIQLNQPPSVAWLPSVLPLPLGQPQPPEQAWSGMVESFWIWVFPKIKVPQNG